MNLFHFSDLAPGSPFFTPAGASIYNELKKFMQKMYLKYGYEEVITPQVFHEDLYKRSGPCRAFFGKYVCHFCS